MENRNHPEIIDVTPSHSESHVHAERIAEPGPTLRPIRRWKMVVSLLKGMLYTATPAILTLISTSWLIQMGMRGQIFAWLLLVIMAPLTLGLTLIAIPINIFLGLALLATAFGKGQVAMQFSSKAQGFRGFSAKTRNVKEVYSTLDQRTD